MFFPPLPVSIFVAAGFVPGATRAPIATRAAISANMFGDLFGGSPEARAAREAEKEAAFRVQQQMLENRRKSGGMITPEEETAIMSRRRAVISDGERALEQLQSRRDGTDKLEEWLQLRESGVIKTATKGMARDPDSARLGSEGLLAERADLMLPYAEEGYVDADADVMSKLQGLFGKGSKR